MRLVIVSGGSSEPSSTRLLADRLATQIRDRAADSGSELESTVIDLRPLAGDIAAAQVAGFPAGDLAAALATVADSDALVVAAPVYKAGMSGLVKSFFDLLDQDALIAVPTVLAATAGTIRHALVVDEEMRSLFAYLRALVVPTAVFAAAEDWGSRALAERIDRAAAELVILLRSGVTAEIRDAGTSYAKVFGGLGAGADQIDLDSDLMRLATGGTPQIRAVPPL